jgi:tetratricopeptide (TPR) repeat protein
MKLALFTEGKEMAETATNLKNDGVEGHYYLAVCLGQWGEANGVFQSLFAVPGILSEATKTIQLDPKFETAGGYMVRGRLYQQAPGGISVGDLKKSQADYEKALELAPNNRVVHRFYAELLISLGQKDKAKEVIEKGLAIPLNKNDRAIEEKEIGLLKALQKKL